MVLGFIALRVKWHVATEMERSDQNLHDCELNVWKSGKDTANQIIVHGMDFINMIHYMDMRKIICIWWNGCIGKPCVIFKYCLGMARACLQNEVLLISLEPLMLACVCMRMDQLLTNFVWLWSPLNSTFCEEFYWPWCWFKAAEVWESGVFHTR